MEERDKMLVEKRDIDIDGNWSLVDHSGEGEGKGEESCITGEVTVAGGEECSQRGKREGAIHF